MRRLTLSLSVIALVAALLPVVRMATAEAAGPAPSIGAPAGKTAVRASDTISVSGDAGGRADGAVPAEVVGLGPDGELFREPVNGLSVSGGQYTGTVTLGCGFGEPGPTRCLDVNPHADAAVTGAAVEIAGAARSNVLRVDYTDPEILRYELVDATHVRVVFSEPVRAPEGDNPVDWDVEHDGSGTTPAVHPAAITDPRDAGCAYPEPAMSTGCTRVLALPALAQQTEDATPFTRYLPNLLSNQSAVYTDYADNSLAIVAAENSNAVDLIRPAAPTIQTIDGKGPAGGDFTSNEATPVVRVGNLRAVPVENADEVHTLEVRVQRDGGTPRTIRQTVAPESNVAEVTLPALSFDAGYTVTAVAIDAAGNRSDDDTKTGPAERTDGARPSARYLLDRVAPQVLAAGLTDHLTVAVEFTEAVLPADDAGRWFVGSIPLTASGTGDTRTLKADVSLANPGRLRWEPTSSEAGSAGSYGDRAGNAMAALSGLTLSDLPVPATPKVTAPTSNTFTSGDQVTIRGTAGTAKNLVAELFDRGSDEVLASAAVNDGRWAITRELAEDARYEFQVRVRNTKTGVATQRVHVADIIRDTAAPEVDVTAPADSLVPLTGQEYGVGDAVTVEWTATDSAVADDQRPDHGKSARVVLVSDTGARRAVSPALEHQPGQRQTFTYKLTESDLGGAGYVDLHFEVVVDDLARNVGSATSGSIRLLASLVGYTPVLEAIAPGGSGSVVEARFPVALTGSIAPGDWRVNGSAVAAQLSGNGRVVVLTVPLAADPNATPRVQYTPTLPAEQRLQTENGRQVSTSQRTTRDRIAPAFDVEAPTTGRYLDARTVLYTGTTDVTARRNTIAAYKATSTGAPTGPAIAKGLAGTDGEWRLRIPLDPNRRNRIVVRALDPSGNRSAVSVPYTFVEDSVSPVVRLLSPRRAGMVGTIVRLRWKTMEANKRFARIQYRPRNGDWKTVTASTPDDGFYKWGLPDGLNGRVFELRVRAYDRVGRQGAASVEGLRADLARPVLYRARTLGPRKVRLFFNEPMDMTREGFTVDGIRVRRVNGDGSRQTLVLRSSLDRTTPTVLHRGTRARDRVGNTLPTRKLSAERGFVFSVTHLDADRLSRRAVRLEWRDGRNRSSHVKQYRIYRDGRRIATVSWSSLSFKDTNAVGGHRYVVKAVDHQGRISTGKAVRVSR